MAAIVARSLALVALLAALLCSGTYATISDDVLTIAQPYVGATSPLTLVFKSSEAITNTNNGGDKVFLKMPNYVLDTTSAALQATTVENCGANVVATATADDSGTSDAKLTFTITGNTVADTATCTITTADGTVKAPSTASTDNKLGAVQIGTSTAANSVTGVDITTYNTPNILAVGTLSATELSFTNTYQAAAAQTVTIKFTSTLELKQGQMISVKLPYYAVTDGNNPTTAGCAGSSFTTKGVANTGEADAVVQFLVGTADLTAATACTIITNDATAHLPLSLVSTGTPQINVYGTFTDISTPTAVTNLLGTPTLAIAYPVINTASAATFTFTPAVAVAITKKITLKLPNFDLDDNIALTSSGCGATTFGTDNKPTASGSGGADATLEFTVTTADLAASTACTITMPSGILKAKSGYTADTAASPAARTVTTTQLATTTGAAVSSITSPMVVSAAAFSNTKLDVATTAGSTATSLSLEFDSNIPLAVGDYVTMTLPNWGVTGTTAPSTSGCGTTTFTTTTGMSGTAHAVVNFIVATATLDQNKHTTHNCTLTWATGATTPSTAQAANLATRTLSATIAAGANIANTTIATSTATTAPAPAPAPAPGNGTDGGTTTGTFSTATTTITFSGYTYAAGAAANINFGNVVGCAYAKTVSDATSSLNSDLCTASAGATFTYLTGSSTTNTVSAARRTGSSVAVALKVYHSLLSQTAAEAAVTQVGTTLATINAAVAAINAAAGTNFSTAQLTASGMTAATWTHSSASVVVPSITAMFSALLLVLMQ